MQVSPARAALLFVLGVITGAVLIRLSYPPKEPQAGIAEIKAALAWIEAGQRNIAKVEDGMTQVLARLNRLPEPVGAQDGGQAPPASQLGTAVSAEIRKILTDLLGTGAGMGAARTPFWLPRNAADDAAIAFAERAIQHQKGGHREQAAILEQVALSRLGSDPTASRDIWSVLLSQIDKTKDSHLENLHRLLIFQRVLDGSLLSARKVDDVDKASQVRTEVLSRVAQERTALAGAVADRLAGVAKEIADMQDLSKAVECLKGAHCPSSATAPVDDSLDAILALIVQDSGALPEAAQQPLEAAIAAAVTLVEHSLLGIQQKVGEQANADRTGRALEPADPQGSYTKLMDEAMSIASRMKSMNLDGWLQFAPDLKVAQKYEDLRGKMEDLQIQIQQLQQSRYNLWAIQQIRVADEVPAWPERLGKIDVRLLHPAVSALYSKSYDDRLREITDASERPKDVRLLINQPKVRLEQF